MSLQKNAKLHDSRVCLVPGPPSVEQYLRHSSCSEYMLLCNKVFLNLVVWFVTEVTFHGGEEWKEPGWAGLSQGFAFWSLFNVFGYIRS